MVQVPYLEEGDALVAFVCGMDAMIFQYQRLENAENVVYCTKSTLILRKKRMKHESPIHPRIQVYLLPFIQLIPLLSQSVTVTVTTHTFMPPATARLNASCTMN